MSEYVQAFVLGNAAIASNVCLLPLYPGLIAFLAGQAGEARTWRASAWLGVLVLLGVLTAMTAVAALAFALRQPLAAGLPYLLPAIYLTVIALALAMLAGRNPFGRLAGLRLPVLRSASASALVFGMLLGPMTLPCVGPLVVSVFLLGAGSISDLLGGFLYFASFGLGFGWPLVVLPWFALPIQRRATRALAHSATLVTRGAGLLLLAVGLYGFWKDVLPNL